MPPFTFVDDKGLMVGSTTPTEVGGKAIDDNFRELANRVGSVAEVAGAPGVTDDDVDSGGNGKFYKWSKWRNTSTNDIYVCLDASVGAAVWVLITNAAGIVAAGVLYVASNGNNGTGTGALSNPFLTPQAAVTAAEAAGGQFVIRCIGDFTGNVLITKPGIHLVWEGGLGDAFNGGDTPTLTGNIAYLLTATAQEINNVLGVNVTGVIDIQGTEPTLVYCEKLRARLVGSNTNGVSRFICDTCQIVGGSGNAAVTLTGATALDCNRGHSQFSGVDGAGVCININAGGDGFVGQDCQIGGQALIAGNAGFTLTGAASNIINAGGACVDRSGGTGGSNVNLFGVQLFGSGPVVLNPGGDPSKFSHANCIVFGGTLNASVGTVLNIDGNQPSSRHSDATVEVFLASDLEAIATAGVITVTGELNIDVKAGFTSDTRFVMAGGFLNIRGLSGSAVWTYSGTGDFLGGTGNVVIIGQSITSSSTGTLFNLTQLPFGLTITQNVQFLGFDALGSIDGGVVAFTSSSFILWGTGLVLSDCTSIAYEGVGSNLDPGTGILTTVSNTKQANAAARFVDITAILSGTTSLLRIDPAIRADNQVTIINGAISGSNKLFDESGTAGSFTAVADALILSETINSVSDDGFGNAQFNHSSVEGDVAIGQVINPSGFVTNTAYNGSFVVINAGINFAVIGVPFGTDEAGGSYSSDSVLVTDAGTSLVDGDTLVINTDGSTDYDGGATVYKQLVNSFQINRVFTATATGSWNTAGLNQKDPRVLAVLQNINAGSKYIATGFVNLNATANPAIVNNTFTDMAFGTAGSALIDGSNMERWKLIDDVLGIFEYTGDEPFAGRITFDFTLISAGGIVDFRFKWLHDIGAGFVDLPDPVEALVAVGNDAQSISKTYPLAAVKGDQIKPQITRNSGASTITTQYATIYATQ